MSKFLPVKAHQQKPSMCGPACLKMVFHYYDTHETEARIAKVAKATFARGTSIKGMAQAANHFGFVLTTKDNATFADIERLLKRGVPPIVDWFSEDEGHYSVVVGLDKKFIYLQDPDIGGLRKMDRQTFFRCWFDFSGDFLRKPEDLNLRRLLTVEPKKQ